MKRFFEPWEWFKDGKDIKRIVLICNVIIRFKDPDVNETYHVLQSTKHTKWNDISFYHFAMKEGVSYPIEKTEIIHKFLTDSFPEEEVKKALVKKLYQDFRVNAIYELNRLKYIGERLICYESLDWKGGYTAGLIRLYELDWTPDELFRIIHSDSIVIYPETVIKYLLNTNEFSSSIKIFFNYFNKDGDIKPYQYKPIFNKVSIFFSDLKDFGYITRHLDEIFADERFLLELRLVIKRYQSEISKIIRKQRGLIIQTGGDSFMAIFKDNKSTNCSTRAVLAAKEVIKFSEAFTSKIKQIDRSIHSRIGICTGNVIEGFIGALDLKEYTVFGMAVNIAKRLESSIKEFPNATHGILINRKCYDELPSTLKEEFIEKHIRIKEIEEEVSVYFSYGKDIPCEQNSNK